MCLLRVCICVLCQGYNEWNTFPRLAMTFWIITRVFLCNHLDIRLPHSLTNCVLWHSISSFIHIMKTDCLPCLPSLFMLCSKHFCVEAVYGHSHRPLPNQCTMLQYVCMYVCIPGWSLLASNMSTTWGWSSCVAVTPFGWFTGTSVLYLWFSLTITGSPYYCTCVYTRVCLCILPQLIKLLST